MHDIGQYPMAHELEEAAMDIFSHKKIGENILLRKDDKESKLLRQLIQKEWQVTTEEIVTLLNTNPYDFSQPIRLRFLKSIIDGPIDADKIDYLMRDSINLNVPYGKGIDIDRLLLIA